MPVGDVLAKPYSGLFHAAQVKTDENCFKAWHSHPKAFFVHVAPVTVGKQVVTKDKVLMLLHAKLLPNDIKLPQTG